MTTIRIGALCLMLGLILAIVVGADAARAQDPTEVAFWSMVRESPKAADIKAYLEAYPRGAYAEVARKRLNELEATASQPQQPGQPARQVPAPSPLPTPPQGGDGRSALTDASTVREVQERLYNLNYEISSINGRLTDETRHAIREWQSNTNRQPTGDMTMSELSALRNARLPTTWGALAYAARGAYAVVWNKPSRQDAVNTALSECRNNSKGGECKYVSAANTACGALGFYTGAVRSTTYWGAYAIVRPTLGQATEMALNECKGQAKRPDVCGVRISFCADGSHRK